MLDIVKRIFDPLGITGKADTGAVERRADRWSTTRRRRATAPTARARPAARPVRSRRHALQAAVDKLSAAVREHYDKVAEIDRLRVHVKDNILYYMQAIWSHEPPDQRFFRLYNIDVPIVDPAGRRRDRRRPRRTAGARSTCCAGRDSAAVQLPMPSRRRRR